MGSLSYINNMNNKDNNNNNINMNKNNPNARTAALTAIPPTVISWDIK